MVVYTTEERVQLICWYLSEGGQEAIGRFIFQFPDRPVPDIRTIQRIFNRFQTTGCVRTCKKCHQPDEPAVRPMSDERMARETNVCGLVEASEPCSSSQLAQNLDMPARTVRAILTRNKYKSYKVSLTQEIFPDDKIRRLLFCEAMREKCNVDENFTFNVLFSDECSFPLHGIHNSSVTRYWSTENKHLHIAARTQYPQKLNVWVGILGNDIIGPYFIEGNLNAAKYLELLQLQIVPAVQAVRPNFEEIWFQQDGCPAHISRPVREFLAATFQGRCISSISEIKWPARTPDLSPNDFFLWGYLKSKIYSHEHDRAQNLHQLRDKIVDALESITPETLANVRREFYDRLGYCEAQEGDKFEHLI